MNKHFYITLLSKMKAFAMSAIVMLCVSCNENLNVVDELTENVENIDELSNNQNSPVVTGQGATEVATAFWADFNNTTRAAVEDLEYDFETIYSEDGPQMYVFNFKDGGFVVVSATKEYYPILAYSEDGTFPVGEEKEGLKLWLDDVKGAISNSAQQEDSIKAIFRMMWGQYEMLTQSATNPSTRTTRMTIAEQVLMQRLEYYYRLTSGSGGWNFRPLSQAASVFEQYGLSSEYQALCNRAQYNNSDLDETLIGWRVVIEGGIYGPFLNTAWHQHSPFNDNLGDVAGCGAIAVSQLMKYYEYPATFTLNGTTYNWDNIPNEVSSSSNQAELVKYVYDTIDSEHLLIEILGWGIIDCVYTSPGDLRDGMRSIGYNVTRQNHNYHKVITELHDSKPVIMLGNEDNPPEWGNVADVGNSHYWVCDGVNHSDYYFEYFTEWQPYSSGTMEPGWYSLESPNRIQPGFDFNSLSFHMNWGWSNSAANGWFIDDSVNSAEGNYHNNREDFIISVPE